MSQYSKLERNLCYPLMVSLLLFIKILSHQLFGKSYFPINTTLETMKCDLFKHKLFQKNSQKMWWAVVMCKIHDNSAPKMDFRHVLRCVCNHTPFLTKPGGWYILHYFDLALQRLTYIAVVCLIVSQLKIFRKIWLVAWGDMQTFPKLKSNIPL